MNLLSRLFHLKHTPTQMPPTGRYIPPLIHTMRHFFASAAVFFRRSRLFFREAAFFSGGEGCEWGAKQPTVGESGDKAENEFSGFIPLVVPRKGFSPHIPASRLFILFHPTKPPSHHPTQATIPPTPIPPNPHQIKQPLSKIALNERAVCGGQIFWWLRGGGM